MEKLEDLKNTETDLSARAQLLTTLDAANKKIADLQKHIDLGNKLIKTKQTRMAEIDKIQEKANSVVMHQADDIKQAAEREKEEQEKVDDAIKATFTEEPKPVQQVTERELKAEK